MITLYVELTTHKRKQNKNKKLKIKNTSQKTEFNFLNYLFSDLSCQSLAKTRIVYMTAKISQSGNFSYRQKNGDPHVVTFSKLKNFPIKETKKRQNKGKTNLSPFTSHGFSSSFLFSLFETCVSWALGALLIFELCMKKIPPYLSS